VLQWAEAGIVLYKAKARGVLEATMAELEVENADWGMRELNREDDTVSARSELDPDMHGIYWLVVEQNVGFAGADGHVMLRLDTNMFAPLVWQDLALTQP
jgi:hypothetical protein